MQNQDHNITKSDIKKTYTLIAPFYYFIFGGIFEHGRRILGKEVAKLAPNKILDIGVGTGMTLRRYPVTSYINGIDICEVMLEVAKKKASQLSHPNIQLSIMDAENLNFEDNSFDCVVASHVLSVTPNPDKLVQELRRVCKKDGTIIILNHFSGTTYSWYLFEKLVKDFAEKVGFRSEFSYQTHIEKYDWQVQKVQSVNLFGLSKLIIIKNI